MDQKDKPADITAKPAFDKATVPTVDQCSMEEAADLGHIPTPRHTSYEQQPQKQVGARPSFYGE